MIATAARFDQLEPGMVVSIGIPVDENSSFMRGARMAPSMIREAVHSESSNLSTEKGPDLGVSTRWQDLGELELSSGAKAFTQIENTLDQLLAHDVRVLSLGGDHSITYPILRAYAKKYPGLAILQLDAHPDLYDEYDGNRYSHASPFARIMEETLASRLVQVGIRTMTQHTREQAARFGVEVIDISDWQPDRTFEFDVPLYLSLDMDVLDPAFAPGISHYEPGGFSTRQVLSIIQGFKATLVGADIVEFNPARDPSGVTAMVAAKFYKEIVARLLI
jgi:arginase